MSILEAKRVSIRYITGDFKDIGLKEFIIRHIQGKYHVTDFWADRNVSFSLERGEMLGIIGANGAGKSTLLKAVAGIMEPTQGSIHREGSIVALLELASGFDGDLTVRENTYLRGAMLGYTRRFIDETYEQIMDFAELREFQDRPFKQLSSGMKSRLAFAIACLVKPDILILDEVLSVGDSGFRMKSEAKMREIIRGGTTTILVSHSINQVRELCNKVLWLHHGRQIAFGDQVDTICDAYEAMMNLSNHGETPELRAACRSDETRLFTVQPQSVTALLGEDAVFHAEGEGEGQFFYQWEYLEESTGRWRKNFRADCQGLNTPTLTVPASVQRTGAKYRCVLLGVYDNIYSDEATLSVEATGTVEILAQPQSAEAAEGGVARFEVQTNQKGLSYQWQICKPDSTIWNDVVNINCKGMRSPTLTVPAESYRNGYQYRCKISGISDTVCSETVSLTVKSRKNG